MLREGLSPDCQKMKDKFENEKNIAEEKIKDEDRSWTTFLQKSTNLPTQKLGHFADLQNKFEKQVIIPLPNPKQEIPNVDINEKLNEERKSEHTVDQIIQEALIKMDSLNIGAGKNRLIQLLLNNIKNITDSGIPVEDQLNQMRKQIETLEEVPDIIKETLENVAGKLHLINQVRIQDVSKLNEVFSL
ncbi:hypothetical protein RR48_00722 [Papilio machaon]|uniref:Uncharacterized protein n=1 Tax=Papilio machaon TaxID=76193 RepID=A0A0N0PB87_PAPMA|nr:hypothetical protein RR48_00722 [Papilio machaon]